MKIRISCGIWGNSCRWFFAALTGLACLVPARVGLAQISFEPGQTLPVGDRPTDTLVGDFDGDSHLDIAAPNLFSSTISVYLGDGTGSFVFKQQLLAGAAPVFLASGDFDENGSLDLAATDLGDDTVIILLNQGNGEFSVAQELIVGNTTRAALVMDLDQDTHLDIAAVSEEGVSILIGDGTGSFTKGTTLPAGSFPRNLAGGDFNEDGFPDVVVVNKDSNDLYLYFGNGMGGILASDVFFTASDPTVLAVADYNQDGDLDVAVGHNTSSIIRIFFGDGTGDFMSQDLISLTRSRDLTTADFNQDGALDLAQTAKNDDALAIYEGDGNGGFAPMQIFATGKGPSSATPGDFNEDGLPDVAVSSTIEDSVLVLINTSGPFSGMCLEGTVGGGVGPGTKVLLVNGSAGTGASRTVTLAPNDPIVYSLVSPPSRAGLSSRYIAYEWGIKPDNFSQRVLPFSVGTTCLPTPITDGDPNNPLYPQKIWNTFGFGPLAGFPTHASDLAPTDFFTYPNGLGTEGCLFIQAIIADFDGPSRVAVAVTNGVVIAVENP